eukprot:CAMPEP_0176433480 /NCGR_PEP_ID=MMETSP0127-20121128/16047_1 /TAXON_ID=938130 /ORGANISM="Platyophrya macrostoma, Strain WH" /LENGTH=684 /DNA_ID=CAMNT_0017815915 /DNA_START=144 /DNA_END=2198 /DNA_ORIENTATION=-
MLHDLFSQYGKILRILIFEKMQVWKAFVEYDNVESAIKAKKNLDNFLMFSDGSRINIYFSNLEVIRFQNNNDGGIDYTLNDPMYSQQNQQTIESFFSPPTIDPRMMGGGGLMQGGGGDNMNSSLNQSLNQSQQMMNPVQSSRYPQGDRVPFARTINRAKSHYYGNPGTMGLSQIDSENEEDKPLRQIPMSYPMPFQKQPIQQIQQPINQQSSPFRSDEQKLPDPNSNFHINSFFSGEPSDAFQPTNFPTKKSPGVFNQDSFFDIAPKDKSQVNYDEIMTKMQEDIKKYSINENFPVQNFSNGGDALQYPNLKSIPNSGFDQLLSKSTGPELTSNEGPIMNSFDYSGQRDFFEPQYQKPQQPQMFQGQSPMQKIPFTTSPNFQEPTFPEFDINASIDQSGLLNTSTKNDAYRGMIPNTQTIPTMSSFVSQDPKMMSGPMMSPESLLGLNFSQIPELQNFDPADLKDPAKLVQLYEYLRTILGRDSAENQPKGSPVLNVSGLEHPDFKVHMLHNIFSNFGNILTIIFTRSKGSALIEFENADSAALCRDYLNNVTFMGKTIKVDISNPDALRIKKNIKGPTTDEIFIGTEKSFRFKKNRKMSINPPSSSLHISNLVKEACTESIIRQLFEGFGRVDAMRFLFVDNIKNMCIVRMGSVEESLNAMAFLHDYDLMGRRIQISFTCSKI